MNFGKRDFVVIKGNTGVVTGDIPMGPVLQQAGVYAWIVTSNR